MGNDGFMFPACENIEKKEDKKIWYWADCIETTKKSGAKCGTLEFWLVYKYRVYETHGRYGFCVANYDTLAEVLGVSVEQIKTVHQNACMKGRLFHIWCDKKVYRNKTKIYVTKEWLEEKGLSSEQIKVLSKGNSNTHKLTGKVALSGEIIDAEIVKNDTRATSKNVEPTSKNVETTSKNVETTSKNVESPLMNKLNNILKGINLNEYKSFVSKETMDINKNFKNNIKENNSNKTISPVKNIGASSLEGITNQTSDKNQTNLSNTEYQSHEPNPPSCAVPPSQEKLKTDEKEIWKQEFLKLWAIYPRKEGKADGLKAYVKARRNGVSGEQIAQSLVKYKAKIEHQKTERKYIIKGGNWFKGERWEDEIEMCDEKKNEKTERTSKTDNELLDFLGILS